MSDRATRPRRARLSARAFGALLAATLAAAALAQAARSSLEIGTGAAHASLAVDASGDALVTWSQGGSATSVLVPPSGQVSHGGVLRGADVSRPAMLAGLPDLVALRRTPDGRYWALQFVAIATGAPQLDLSRWRGAATAITLAYDGARLSGRVSVGGTPVTGLSATPGRRRPRVYVYLACNGCRGKPGWSPMVGVAPAADGTFAVLLRPSWRGVRYRAAVVGKNSGATLAPDALTIISAG